MATLVYRTMSSPVGDLTLVAGPAGLVAILWPGDDAGRVALPPLVDTPHDPLLRETERQLAAYFAGQRTNFDLPLDFRGTVFQVLVWQALTRIPFGETRSYGQVAAAIGRPQAVRAVGAANGRNPISIVAPCHRVVGASGELTGFAGGLAAKALLLGLEGHSYGTAAMARSRPGRPSHPRRTGSDHPTLFADDDAAGRVSA